MAGASDHERERQLWIDFCRCARRGSARATASIDEVDLRGHPCVQICYIRQWFVAQAFLFAEVPHIAGQRVRAVEPELRPPEHMPVGDGIGIGLTPLESHPIPDLSARSPCSPEWAPPSRLESVTPNLRPLCCTPLPRARSLAARPEAVEIEPASAAAPAT